MPSISVIIPLYNHEKYIRMAVESILAQEGILPPEIIVVNDGSTDNSDRVMAELCHSHPEIVYWTQPNKGAFETINSGIRRASGELVAILNSDDCYHPLRLKQCMQILSESPEVMAVTTALDFIDAVGKKVKNPWYVRNTDFYKKERDLALSLMNGNFFMTTSNIVIRQRVFHEIGYFAPLRYVHDLDFFLRLLVHGKIIHFIDTPLLSYRIHPKNTILEAHVNVRVEWAFACARFMATAMRIPEWREKGWAYVGRLNRIMEKHSLTRLLNLFFLFFITVSDTESDMSHFYEDAELMRLLRQAAQ